MNGSAPHLSTSDLTAELARLHAAGFSLLPLGRRADGKAPLLRFSGAERLPLKRCWRRCTGRVRPATASV